MYLPLDGTGPLLTLHMTAVRFSPKIAYWAIDYTLATWADRTCSCDGLFDLCYEFCASLFFTYDRSESIMAVFVFYGYWGRAKYKVFAFSTYRRQVMAVFVLPFRSKTAPI